jgi:hypothetical protein
MERNALTTTQDTSHSKASRTIAHTATGPIYSRPGIVMMYPLQTGLQRMRELHRRVVEPTRAVSLVAAQRHNSAGARALHQRAVASALATLQVASNAERLALCRSVFDFAHFAGSSDGIESMLLSCIVTSSRLGSSPLTRAGLNAWRHVGQPTYLGAGFTRTPVLDVSASLISFLSRDDLNVFGASVGSVIPTANGEGVAFGGGMSGVTRGDGPPGLAPGVANSDRDQDRGCIVGFTVVGTALGLVGGFLIGSATAGSDASGLKQGTVTGGTSLLGVVSGAGGGLAFGQAVCGNAAPTTPAANTPAPTDNTGETTTGSSEDQTNYNDGFAAGWAAVTGSTVAPGATVSTSWMNGYADGAAAAAAMPVVAPAVDPNAPTDPTTTDPTPTSDPTTSDPTPSTGPTDPTSGDPTPSDGDGGGPPPSAAGTPQPDGDGGDDGEGSRSYLHSVPTGPGMSGLVTTLAGGRSFIVGAVGQAPGGVSPGLGPDGRTPNDGDGGGGDDNQGRRLPLGANISIPTPRDPELDPHARAGLAAAVVRAIAG